MKIFYRMLLKDTVPVMLLALMFFVLILEMVDLFANLWRYLNQDVPVEVILTIQLYYLPKCIAYAAPISLLFAVSFTLGNLYANNELIALLGSGVSLRRAVVPILVLGFLLGAALLFFEDRIVINTYATKIRYVKTVLGQKENANNTNVTIRGNEGGVIYSSEYYNDQNRTLSNLTVLISDENGIFRERIDAKWAEYSEGSWLLHDCRIFRYEGQKIIEIRRDNMRHPLLTDEPDTFRRKEKNLDELKLNEARLYIEELQKAGRDSRVARTDYYKRIAFIFTPFIVSLISVAVGSRFKKNILLMSLLLSLSISVIFYVFQMITGILANTGLMPPFTGAFLPVIVFFILGITMMRFVRT